MSIWVLVETMKEELKGRRLVKGRNKREEAQNRMRGPRKRRFQKMEASKHFLKCQQLYPLTVFLNLGWAGLEAEAFLDSVFSLRRGDGPTQRGTMLSGSSVSVFVIIEEGTATELSSRSTKSHLGKLQQKDWKWALNISNSRTKIKIRWELEWWYKM